MDGLVGRLEVVAGLRAVAAEAAAGRGRLVLVAGEAGIGKTTLAAAAAEDAACRGARTVWASCWEGDGVPPYWPWVVVLRALAELYPDLAVADAHRVELARLVPEWGPVPPETAGRTTGPERFRLFEAVGAVLLAAAHRQPLTVVVDDLQWADPLSLRLLGFVAQQAATAALLLLGAYRDDGPHTLLAEVGRLPEVTRLGGLAERDVALVMAQVAGAAPADALAREVRARTGGNPFFVREVTRLLVSQGGLPAGRVAGVPDSVRQVLRQRLARLPEPLVQLLTVAAVVGRAADADLLGRAAGTEVAAVVDHMNVAVRAGVITETVVPAGPYRFVHDLFRETLHDDLPMARRAAVHLRVGEALAAGARAPAAEVAHHLLQGMLAAPDPAEAAALVMHHGGRAGAEALAALAFEDAAGLSGRLLDGLGAAGLLTDGYRLELLLSRARAAGRLGDVPRARADLDEAWALAVEGRQAEAMARAALGTHALGMESGVAHEVPGQRLRDAAAALGEQDSALAAELLAALSRERYRDGDRDAARQLSDRAVEIAGRTADDATLAWCLLGQHDTVWTPGTAARRSAIATGMVEAARRAGDSGLAAEGLLLRATARLELAEPGAIDDLREFVGLAVATRQARLGYLAVTRRAALSIFVGELATAADLIVEADAMAQEIAEPDRWNVDTRLRWELASAQGRRAELEARLRECRLPQVRDWYRAQLGLAVLESGRRDEAVQIIRAVVETPPGALAVDYVLLAQWCDLAEAAAAIGHRAACGRYYDALLPHAGGTAVTAALVGFDGAVDHHLGVLAGALGRADDAAAHLADAVAIHERLGARAWLARSQVELAAVLAARNLPRDRATAGELRDAARATATELGMAGVLRRLKTTEVRPDNVFRRDGDGWLVAFAGQQARLRDAKGLRDIATLLAVPHADVPAVTLYAAVESGADAILDGRARREYRARLSELDDDLAEAEQRHDTGRAAAVRAEREFLLRELASAVGLGGRPRGLGDDRERARKAVAARIRDSIGHLAARLPVLGEHLSASISTGHLCAYRPAEATVWRL